MIYTLKSKHLNKKGITQQAVRDINDFKNPCGIIYLLYYSIDLIKLSISFI